MCFHRLSQTRRLVKATPTEVVMDCAVGVAYVVALRECGHCSGLNSRGHLDGPVRKSSEVVVARFCVWVELERLGEALLHRVHPLRALILSPAVKQYRPVVRGIAV